MIVNTRSAVLGLSLAAALGLGTAAFADEVTTKTTTKTTDAPAAVVTTPAPAAGVVVKDAPDCATKKVTKTDADTGDTVSKTKTNCD